MLTTKHDDPNKKLGWGERLAYGSGGFAFNMINGIIGSFLTIYFTSAAGLNAGIIATILAVSKIFDGVSDLIMGRIVDRTNTKMGKARVWLLRMTIPFAISTMLLFFVPKSFPDAVKYVYVFLIYNITNAVCLTGMLVPFYSMVGLVTADSYERGLLGNIQQIFQTLGNVFVNSTFVVLLTRFTESENTIYTQRSFTITLAIYCAIMVVVALFCVFNTKERVKIDATAASETGHTYENRQEIYYNDNVGGRAVFVDSKEQYDPDEPYKGFYVYYVEEDRYVAYSNSGRKSTTIERDFHRSVCDHVRDAGPDDKDLQGEDLYFWHADHGDRFCRIRIVYGSGSADHQQCTERTGRRSGRRYGAGHGSGYGYLRKAEDRDRYGRYGQRRNLCGTEDRPWPWTGDIRMGPCGSRYGRSSGSGWHASASKRIHGSHLPVWLGPRDHGWRDVCDLPAVLSL